MSAALLLATLLMTGLGQVAQKLTVEHWRLVAADGWTARLRSPWPWLALLALGLGLLCWLLLLQRVEVRQRLSDAGAELRPGHPGGTLRLR